MCAKLLGHPGRDFPEQEQLSSSIEPLRDSGRGRKTNRFGGCLGQVALHSRAIFLGLLLGAIPKTPVLNERISETLTIFTSRDLRAIVALMNKGTKDSDSPGAVEMPRSPAKLRDTSSLRSTTDLGSQKATSSTEDPLVDAVIELFRKQPGKRWTVQELARAVGTSRPVLNRRFAAVLDKPPLRVLREMRMNLAAELLRASDEGLVAIADAVGYDSEFALSRAFFRHFGTRPGAFRRGHSGESVVPVLRCAA